MTSWGSLHCGGYGISIKIANPDGPECLTNAQNLTKGETLSWSADERGEKKISGCENMMVTTESTVYIQSYSSNEFCPYYVTITTVIGASYKTNNISEWYDKETSSKRHRIHTVKGN